MNLTQEEIARAEEIRSAIAMHGHGEEPLEEAELEKLEAELLALQNKCSHHNSFFDGNYFDCRDCQESW